MEGSSTDQYAREERVWIKVKPRYARILVPGETKHYKNPPDTVVPVKETEEPRQKSRRVQTDLTGDWIAAFVEPEELKRSDVRPKQVEREEELETDGMSSEVSPSSSMEEEEMKSPEGSGGPMQGAKEYNPPTTSKAAPPKPKEMIGPDTPAYHQGWTEEGSDENPESGQEEEQEMGSPQLQPQQMDQEPHQAGKRVRSKEEPEEEKSQAPDGGGAQGRASDSQHRMLTDLLPHYLDPRTEGELRSDMELILERHPIWLQQQIKKELRGRSTRQGWPVTSKQANIVLWRNYRLKISQVTALFAVSGMKKVVDKCLEEEAEDQTQPTG